MICDWSNKYTHLPSWPSWLVEFLNRLLDWRYEYGGSDLVLRKSYGLALPWNCRTGDDISMLMVKASKEPVQPVWESVVTAGTWGYIAALVASDCPYDPLPHPTWVVIEVLYTCLWYPSSVSHVLPCKPECLQYWMLNPGPWAKSILCCSAMDSS